MSPHKVCVFSGKIVAERYNGQATITCNSIRNRLQGALSSVDVIISHSEHTFLAVHRDGNAIVQ
jgi:hypothetical protein